MKRDLFFFIALLLSQLFTLTSGGWQSRSAAADLPQTAKTTSIADVNSAPVAGLIVPPPAPVFIATLQPKSEDNAPQNNIQAESKIKRVLVVSFDGMRPDTIAAAPMPNLLRLMKNGAYTLSATTISYPTTLPSHTSMLSGLCMEKHGLGFNSRNLYRGYSQGVDIFDLTHNANMKSVMIVAKDKLEQIPAPGTVDVFELYPNEPLIAQAAIEMMPSDFDLMFLHFPSGDVIGHKWGWMSLKQLSAFNQSDEALGLVLEALEANGMRESTLVIVTADHGGHDQTHDGTKMEDYIIPWVASGPGVVPGELNSVVKTMDTAATIAYALGLPLQPEWDGIPIYEAFGVVPQDIHYLSSPCE